MLSLSQQHQARKRPAAGIPTGGVGWIYASSSMIGGKVFGGKVFGGRVFCGRVFGVLVAGWRRTMKPSRFAEDS